MVVLHCWKNKQKTLCIYILSVSLYKEVFFSNEDIWVTLNKICLIYFSAIREQLRGITEDVHSRQVWEHYLLP